MTADTHELLVSLHLPKTAGSSFAAALRQHYNERLYEDYRMLPMQLPRGRREWQALRDGLVQRVPAGAMAIHGHFLPVKYRWPLRGRRVAWITWLRNPVERLLSHYHFWARDYDGRDPAQSLRNRVLAEDWSLERFCLGPELRNLYGQYLWGFDPGRFVFIGLTEHYAQDLAWFSQRFLGRDVLEARIQANPARESSRYPIDADLRSRIERHHAADVALYRQAVATRNLRCSQAGQPETRPEPD